MSYLIYCSMEVGGLPYAIADMLNRNGIETFYVSTARRARGHDSKRFHFGDAKAAWDLTGDLAGQGVAAGLGNLARRLGSSLKGCFATGGGAYHLQRAGIPYKYWSYGSDLDLACFWPRLPARPLHPRDWLLYGYYVATIGCARQSIRAADAVMISPYQFGALEKVRPGHAQFFLPHFAPVSDFDRLRERRAVATEKLRRSLGAQHVFFSSTRQSWGDGARCLSDRKGNDAMLRAFARFLSVEGAGAAKLLLVRKGPSIAASARLADALGVSGDVVWLEEMRRSDLETYYLGSDLCLGQFDTPVLTNTTIEPLALGVPTASFIGSAEEDKVVFYRDAPPVCNALDPNEIAGFMRSITRDPSARERIERESWDWVSRNCSERMFVESFVELFSR